MLLPLVFGGQFQLNVCKSEVRNREWVMGTLQFISRLQKLRSDLRSKVLRDNRELHLPRTKTAMGQSTFTYTLYVRCCQGME